MYQTLWTVRSWLPLVACGPVCPSTCVRPRVTFYTHNHLFCSVSHFPCTQAHTWQWFQPSLCSTQGEKVLFCLFTCRMPHTFSLQGFCHYVLLRACLLELLAPGVALSGTFIICSHHGYTPVCTVDTCALSQVWSTELLLDFSFS